MFSFGEIPNGSKVYLTVKYQGYDYFAFASSDNVVFKSVDPALEVPSTFTVITENNRVSIGAPNGKFLSTNGRTLNTFPSYFTLFSNLNLNNNIVYGGIYYQMMNFEPSLADRPLIPLPIPFGGALSIYKTITGLSMAFIPVDIPNQTTTPGPFIRLSNMCVHTTNINILVSNWMKGFTNGCTNINSCVFTDKTQCDSEYIPPYCGANQFCGNCFGLCENTNQLCIYDANQTNVPFYTCTTTPPPPPPDMSDITSVSEVPTTPLPGESFWDEHKIAIIVIILILTLLIIAGILYYGSRKNKIISVTQ